ncbi:phage major tail protein, TP901-1 family [Eupransor demetentiae]|uniref:Phage major tail protein, TP901-1 family n=1 Tax=Eupransor demetentiae TaxID=3109584 RepID=A0ABM9N4L6_9LACO|nr:hypothetical protein R54876_GBNLAHCA_00678 [Lactobacillaceae bacterium LMG 33000]
MAETGLKALSGGKALVFARLLEDEAKRKGIKVAYQTTYSYKTSRDKKTEDTKDGSVSKGGSTDGTLSLEILASNQDILDMLDDANEQNKKVEFWIVYTDTPGSAADTYAARYMRAGLTSMEEGADSDASLTRKFEANIDGGFAKRGELTLKLDDASNGTDYNFRDLGVVSSSESSNSATAPKSTSK